MNLEGFLRSDGRKGIRNTLLVIYLVECAHHVVREIAVPFRDKDVHVVGFSGCFPSEYAHTMLYRLSTHPNVGGVLLVSLGCESFNRGRLQEEILESGRPVHTLVIQERGGTEKTVAEGRQWVESALKEIEEVPRVSMAVKDLIVGTICGGSDASSGISANPVIGYCFDRLVKEKASCIFEETGELIGCEQIMADRAIHPGLAKQLLSSVTKAAEYYSVLGHGSFAPGNADGGLTTQEEKSMGAYAKSGSSKITGILKPGDQPGSGGLYLLDVVPDGEVRFGFPNINDSAEIAELIACGAHLILFSTGRGSVVGSVISPVIKICGNPETFRRMEGDMDVDAGRILEGKAEIPEVGNELYAYLLKIAEGEKSKSESLGHQEFVLTYKKFQPLGPACFPG
jgi:altronate dehydratase large subunit